MTWKGESRRHSLARKGIKTASGQPRYFVPHKEVKPSSKVGTVIDGHFVFYEKNEIVAVPIFADGTLDWDNKIEELELKSHPEGRDLITQAEIKLEDITELQAKGLSRNAEKLIFMKNRDEIIDLLNQYNINFDSDASTETLRFKLKENVYFLKIPEYKLLAKGKLKIKLNKRVQKADDKYLVYDEDDYWGSQLPFSNLEDAKRFIREKTGEEPNFSYAYAVDNSVYRDRR